MTTPDEQAWLRLFRKLRVDLTAADFNALRPRFLAALRRLRAAEQQEMAS